MKIAIAEQSIYPEQTYGLSEEDLEYIYALRELHAQWMKEHITHQKGIKSFDGELCCI